MIESQIKTVYRIMDLHESERPRERLASLGPQALSNAELIAILLRVGVKGESAVTVGQRLLTEYKGLRGLHRVPFDDLKNSAVSGTPRHARSRRRSSWDAGLLSNPRRSVPRSIPPATLPRWCSMRCLSWSRSICA